MKKLITTLFVLLAAVLCAFSFVSCTDEVPTECEHAGGTATCTGKAVCATCGKEYGDLDSSNHASEGVEYVSNGNGTHNKVHACCKAVIDADVACDGGTATCTEKAVCATCGSEYGDLDSSNHASTEFNYVTNGNGTHKKIYKCCEAVATENEACSGGEATVCGSKNVCESCGTAYGEPLAHSWSTAFESDGTQHWHTCLREGCTATSEKEACAGGTATCTEKAVCATCGSEYGEINAGNHDLESHDAQAATCTEIGWEAYQTCKRDGCAYTTYTEIPALDHDYSTEWSTDENQHWHDCSRCDSKNDIEDHVVASFTAGDTEDTELCSCGYKMGTFNKVVSILRQDIILSATTNTLSLDGVSEYDTVVSIVCGDLSFGTVLNELTIPEGIGSMAHGEQNLTVTVKKGDFEHIITVPVTIIDDVLTADNLKANIQSQGTALSEGKYFILTSDIDASAIDWKTSDLWDQANGFKGSIDGRGYTVKNLNIVSGAPGIFNCTKNATVKNINFTVSTFVPQANKSVFGLITEDSTFENISITFNCQFVAEIGGILSGNNAVRNKYKNIEIDATGSTIFYLVCGSAYGNSSDYTGGITVYADKVTYIYGTTTEVEHITVKETIKLTDNQEIVMTDETYSLDLGETYSGLTVTSITCDGENLGTDLNSLDLTAFKTDYAKHGEKTVIVRGKKDGSKVIISVPVTLVTKMISTLEELRTITRVATDTEADAIFGYYKLANDINCNGSPDWAGFYNDVSFDNQKSTTGFRGTLDGNGYTLTGQCHYHGLFRVIGNGAVIKNITFESNKWVDNASGGLFGYTARGATFDNVNVIMKSTDASKLNGRALLFTIGCQGNTFNNCTFKVYSDEGTTLAENVPSVFGAWVSGNTYTDVDIYCASYVKLSTDDSSKDVTEIDGVTVHTTEE